MQNQAEEIVLLSTNDGKEHRNENVGLRSPQNSIDRRHQKLLKRFLERSTNRTNIFKNILLWLILFSCLFILVCPLALHLSYVLPAIKPRTIPLHEFSEERARDYYSNLTQYGPRVINTNADYQTRQFLLSELHRMRSLTRKTIRFEISLQNFTVKHIENLQNIAVRLSDVNSPDDTSCLMLTAHYDSVEFSPGGSDDGSGVVILLELLSNLIHDTQVSFARLNLIILFVSGEEMDLRGAEAFIAAHPWKKHIRRFMNIDSVGGHEKAILFQVKPSQLIRDYAYVPRPHANVIGDEIFEYTSSVTDYNAFTSNGFLSGYDFAYYLDGYNYHTILDKPSIVENGALQHLGENVLSLTHRIFQENEQIQQQSDPMFDPEENLIYFDILGRHLIIYRKSTGNIIQLILIILIVIIGCCVIFIDHRWSTKYSSENDLSSIYFYFKYPLLLRFIFIFLFFLTYLFSFIFGPFFATVIAFIISKFRSLSWYGNSTLAVFLYGLPCLIGVLLCETLWDYLRKFLLSKYPKKNPMEIDTIKHIDRICFNFERHWSLLLVFVLFMSVSIYFPYRSTYFILLWSIFLCPIYFILILFKFITRWYRIQIVSLFHEQEWYWLFAPYIISLIPLIHTLEMTSRLLRLAIPMMARMINPIGFSHDIVICLLIVLPAILFFLIFIPNLQRLMNYSRILIILTASFLIVLLIACVRSNFTSEHPKIFYIQHQSETIYSLTNMEKVPLILSKTSQTSTITLESHDNLILSPTLDRISRKTGFILENRQCSKPTQCSFDDTFNRTNAFQQVELTSMKTLDHYRFTIQHASSYDIQIESGIFHGHLTVENETIKPRTQTIVNIETYSQGISFSFIVTISRCDLADSPFLLTVIDKLPELTPFGRSQCKSIQDKLVVNVDKF